MKRKKKVKILLFIILSIIIPKEINAASDYMIIGEKIPNEFIKLEYNHLKWVKEVKLIKRFSDNRLVYNIIPGLDASDKIEYYEVINNEFKSQISDEEWEKIKLIAYYGYNYQNHTELKWYSVTQIVIWKVLRPSWDIYYTDTLNGTRLYNKYEEEIEELKNLVNNHYNKPKFDSTNYEISFGNTLTLIDSNNELNNFKIDYNKDIIINQKDNKLSLEFLKSGNFEIELYKDFDLYNNKPLLYINDTYANTMIAGNLNRMSTKLNIQVTGGSLSLQKIDITSKENQECTLEGSIYQIFDDDNNLIDEIITNEDGAAKTNNILKYGYYYVIEKESSLGYKLDTKKYYFEINEDESDINLNIYSMQIIKKENIIDDVITVNIPNTGLNTIEMKTSYYCIIPEIHYYGKKKKRKN